MGYFMHYYSLYMNVEIEKQQLHLNSLDPKNIFHVLLKNEIFLTIKSKDYILSISAQQYFIGIL